MTARRTGFSSSVVMLVKFSSGSKTAELGGAYTNLLENILHFIACQTLTVLLTFHVISLGS